MTVQLEITHYIASLPPRVAAIAWDIMNDHVTENTLELARRTSEEEFKRYDFVRALAAGNPNFLEYLTEDCKVLIERDLEDMGKLQCAQTT
jgi:hypothetical protein